MAPSAPPLDPLLSPVLILATEVSQNRSINTSSKATAYVKFNEHDVMIITVHR